VSYWNEKGEQLKGKLDELRSRVFQHEYDHLDGLLMTEHPSAKIVMRGTGRNIRK
jgi:peptide deformylase